MSEEINLSHVIISEVVSFVSMDTVTNHLHVVALNEMLSLYSSALSWAWFYLDAQVLFY